MTKPTNVTKRSGVGKIYVDIKREGMAKKIPNITTVL